MWFLTKNLDLTPDGFFFNIFFFMNICQFFFYMICACVRACVRVKPKKELRGRGTQEQKSRQMMYEIASSILCTQSVTLVCIARVCRKV